MFSDEHESFFSEAEVRAMAKERQKKDNHNLSEFELHKIKLKLWKNEKNNQEINCQWYFVN